MSIDWGFITTLVIALLIVSMLNRWMTKNVASPVSTIAIAPPPLPAPAPQNPAQFVDLYHAGADSIE